MGQRNQATVSDMAKSEPQAAYGAFTHSLISEWTYLLRTAPVRAAQLNPLKKPSETTSLLPYRASHASDQESVISLPTRLSEIDIMDPRSMLDENPQGMQVTQPVIKKIRKRNYIYTNETKEAKRKTQHAQKSRERKRRQLQ